MVSRSLWQLRSTRGDNAAGGGGSMQAAGGQGNADISDE